MEFGTLHKLIDILFRSFNNLKREIPFDKLEKLAITIHKSMTLQGRHFHNMDHIFSFTDPDKPLEALAACFHDIVYFQVDKGVTEEIGSVISPYAEKRGDDIFISNNIGEDDQVFELTMRVFGYKRGDKLSPFSGLNEFFSALFMNKSLEGILKNDDLLITTVCIEATIPFRKDCFIEEIEERLKSFSLSREEIESIVKMAIIFSNKDVENFSEDDPGRFLDNTWKLLPETNYTLRANSMYSIRDYRIALEKMAGFFSFLNPDNIFHAYKGVPDAETFARIVEYAHTNVFVARDYLKIKLITIAILECVASLTGGNVPIALFMGDIPREGEVIDRLENYLPIVDSFKHKDKSSIIYRLLESGRVSESSFDMKRSPLSLFIYKSLSNEELNRHLDNARQMFSEKITVEQFFFTIDRDLLKYILKAAGYMVFTRKDRIEELIAKLS